MIRILVVDDSAFMRKALSKMLEGDPEIQVVATARDGLEGLEKIQELDPDVVTLDIEMPRMDGIEALSRIMATCPRPVLMVSSLTEEGAEVTFQALDLGAADYIPKQLDGNLLEIVRIEQVLREKVKALARRKRRGLLAPAGAPAAGPAPLGAPVPAPVPSPVEPRPRGLRLGPAKYMVIGASTGGPPALQKVISGLPAGFPAPVVVVQHMPKSFTGPFARRLSQLGPLEITEARTGDRLEPGRGFVAPGGCHLVVAREGGHLVLHLTEKPEGSLHKPSVDVTFRSFADTVGATTLSVVLTGMGSDGMEGVRALKARGAWSIAQSAETCVVYGMPRAVVEAGLADVVLPVDEIASAMQGAAV